MRRFGTSTGLLVKLLDAAERLPVHAHPDRVFAHQHLVSRFGKTEAWIVLATREETAEVWVGLRAAVDADLRAHEPIRELAPEASAFFWADEMPEPPGRFAVVLILEGNGAINGAPVSAGDAFAVPAACDRLEVGGTVRVLRCLAPLP